MANTRMLITVWQPTRYESEAPIAEIAIVGDFETSYTAVSGYEIFCQEVGG